MAVNSCWQLTADGAVNRRSDRWLVDSVPSRLPIAATVTTTPWSGSNPVSFPIFKKLRDKKMRGRKTAETKIRVDEKLPRRKNAKTKNRIDEKMHERKKYKRKYTQTKNSRTKISETKNCGTKKCGTKICGRKYVWRKNPRRKMVLTRCQGEISC